MIVSKNRKLIMSIFSKIKNVDVIEKIHPYAIDLQSKIVKLETEIEAKGQDKLIAFKVNPNDHKKLIISGTILGIVTLSRTLIQVLVRYGYEKEKYDQLQFPPETVVNSDFYLEGINLVDGFFEIEEIQIQEPNTGTKIKWLSLGIVNVLWKIVKFIFMLLGVFYLIEMLFLR